MRRMIVLALALVALVSVAGVWLTAAAQDGTPAAGAGTPCPAGAATGTPGASPAAATPETTTPAASPAASPAAGAEEGCAVEIKDFAFNPAVVEIPVGTTITWTNADTVPHTATAPDGTFNSENLNQGQSYSHTFDAAGSHDYVCLYHANMKGTVVVQ